MDKFLIPILAGSTEKAYRLFAEKAVAILKDHGATRVVEGSREVPGGMHIVMGIDPRGAALALVGGK